MFNTRGILENCHAERGSFIDKGEEVQFELQRSLPFLDALVNDLINCNLVLWRATMHMKRVNCVRNLFAEGLSRQGNRR